MFAVVVHEGLRKQGEGGRGVSQYVPAIPLSMGRQPERAIGLTKAETQGWD